jgi:hypothetical protein
MRPARDLEWLLDHLCRKYGFCLSADKRKDIIGQKDWRSDEFALAVLKADGFENPEHESNHRRTIADAFTSWFTTGS